MRAFLDKASLIEHDDAVHARDRRKAMRDGNHRLARQQLIERVPNRRLDLGIQSRRRFITGSDVTWIVDLIVLCCVIMTKLALKRVYDPPAKSDGARVLIDRLWPRGIAKEKAKIDLWLKDIAPSHELRKKFHGHPEAWDDFASAYAKELRSDAAQAAVAELDALSRKGPVTLLYAARDDVHNNAMALKAWLEKRK